MDERNIDVQIIGPRPFMMMGWMQPHLLPAWTRFVNDCIHKQVQDLAGVLGIDVKRDLALLGPVDTDAPSLDPTAAASIRFPSLSRTSRVIDTGCIHRSS